MKSSAETLQTIFASGRRNNLNAIRLVLAILVIMAHTFPASIGKKGDPLFIFSHGWISVGDLAVEMFFFISGFLITASWFNAKSMNDYMRRRILRIVPGYVVALVVSFLVAMCFAPEPFANLHARLGRFAEILWLDCTSVCGSWVFPNNPYPHEANGSLWTIQREFVCYLLVAGIGLFGWFKNRASIFAITCVVIASFCMSVAAGKDVIKMDRRLLSFFLAGVCVWLWRDKIYLRRTGVALALGIVGVTSVSLPIFRMLAPFAIAYLLLWTGFCLRTNLTEWCDRTDLSYGTYLFAWPIQQIVAASGMRDPWTAFAIVTPITLLVALLSWKFVEHPALRLKSRDFSDRDPALTRETKRPAPIVTTAQTAW